MTHDQIDRLVHLAEIGTYLFSGLALIIVGFTAYVFWQALRKRR